MESKEVSGKSSVPASHVIVRTPEKKLGVVGSPVVLAKVGVEGVAPHDVSFEVIRDGVVVPEKGLCPARNNSHSKNQPFFFVRPREAPFLLYHTRFPQI